MASHWATVVINALLFLCLGIGISVDVSVATTTTNSSRALLYNAQRNIHANISELLDNLLRGYDNSVRPDFGGPPAVVEVDIMVRSMGPISEVDMTYSMDCYFRQSWVDRRLAFKGGGAQDTLALSISMLAKIWKPDTYFYNGKQSYLHTITTPNKFVRLHQDGRVLYSSRLTIKAGCPMRLEKFPMDTQKCPLKLGSFGYTTRDVIYRWNPKRQVAIAPDMKLSQFDLVDCPAGNTTDRVVHQLPDPSQQQLEKRRAQNKITGGDQERNTQQQHQQQKEESLKSSTTTSKKKKHASFVEYEYSMLVVNFHLQRHMGNFLIQVYGPCILLVVLSWVSFWLNREATADRVSLGITTVLTMTFLGLEARTDLPKVPYPTALDFFVFMSFAFIFATILQFAFVHYFTKYGSGECYFIEGFHSESDQSDCEEAAEEECLGEEEEDEEALGEEEEEDHESGELNGVHHHNIHHNQQHNHHLQSHHVHHQSLSPRPDTLESNFLRRTRQQQRERDVQLYEVIPLSVCSVNSISPTKKTSTYSIWDFFCPRPNNKTHSDLSHHRDPGPAFISGSSSVNQHQQPRKSFSKPFHRSSSSHQNGHQSQAQNRIRRRGRRRILPRFNSVSKIDRISRVLFPLTFLVINLFYWHAYLSSSGPTNDLLSLQCMKG